jgi:two-component system, NarL family, response regulator DegU
MKFGGFLMKKKILIVDDHDGFRNGLKKFFEKQKLNLEIYMAGSEKSAIATAAKKKPDIVLLELQLPKMNGIKTSRLIKDVSPKSKIVVVSTFDTEKFKNNFINAHVDAFIGKCEFDGKLLHILKKYLKGN